MIDFHLLANYDYWLAATSAYLGRFCKTGKHSKVQYRRMLDWGKLLAVEVTAITGVMFGLGFIKAPRFLMRRKLSNRFPWGYYADQVPKEDEGYSAEHKDFLHDIGTEFGGGLEGFGDYGEFTGWGEMGEYGSTFFADGGSGAE